MLRSAWYIKADKQKPLGILNWDMFGYYLYLPSAFIYNDIGLENKSWIDNLFKKYEPSDYFYQTAEGKDGRRVNIYSMGTAVVYAPGFFIACLAAKIAGYENDGYSLPFEVLAVVTFLAVFVINIYLLRKLLLEFFSDKVTAILMLLLVPGTNYFYQCAYDGFLPHNFIVTLLTSIIILTIKWHKSPTVKTSLLIGLCIGLAAIIRPPAIIFSLVPVLWGITGIKSFGEKLKLYKQNISKIFAAVVVVFLIGIPQLIYFKYTSGNWLSFNRSETLDWWHAHVNDFLFSYKKGWLLYTPVMVLAIAGFIPMYRGNKQIFFPALIILIIQVWMLSAWDAWWFHTSYSQRGMVDIYSLLALPLGYIINSVMLSQFSLLKLIFFPVAAFLIFLSLFQTWQYMHRILHWDRETKKYYWKTFLSTSVSELDKKYLEVNRAAEDDSAFNSNLNRDYLLRDKKILEFNNSEINTVVINGEGYFKMDADIEYSPELFNNEWKPITTGDHLVFQAKAEILAGDSVVEEPLLMVAKTVSDDLVMHHKTVELLPEKNKIKQIALNYITPVLRHRDDKVVIFLWNPKHKNFLINKMSLHVYEPRNDWNK